MPHPAAGKSKPSILIARTYKAKHMNCFNLRHTDKRSSHGGALLICALALLIAPYTATAKDSAKEIICQLDDITGQNPEKVKFKPYVTLGTMIPAQDDNAGRAMFDDLEFAASWSKGDQYEPQTYLRMQFGNTSSTVYDISEDGQIGPVNVMIQGRTRFQCWFE